MRLFRSPRRPAVRLRAHTPLLLEVLEDRTLLSTSLPGFAVPGYTVFHPAGTAAPLASAGPSGYTPSQVRHAYGFDQVSLPGGVPGDGSGTTIAIIDAYDDPNIASDLQQFDQYFGLPDPTFTKVNQSGGSQLPQADSSWAVEIALDVEWAHAIAPGANILLVEASSSSTTDLFAGVRYAASQPGVVAVSMSWGGGESPFETLYDSTFVTPAGHSGVTFLASSGDSGAPPGYPAAAPNVVAVGGTTLNLDSSGNYLSESGWSGSGGGVSPYEAQPAYQQGMATQSSTRRTNPDVAYDADPNTGVPVYDSYTYGAATPWVKVGGTSAAAPQWAALIAIADQGRALTGQDALDGRSQTLPMLYALPASDFHDITTGNNGFPAGPGYDLVTGRGTPIANKVVADLVGSTANPVVTDFLVSAPASSTAGAAFSVTVTALDQNNNPVSGYTGTVHFASSDPSAVLPADYTFTAADNGTHTFTNGVTLQTAGSQTVTVTDDADSSVSGSATVTVSNVTQAGTHLAFLQQPASAAAGSPISPAVTVEVLDGNNNVVTTDNSDQVTLVLGSNPGGGALRGTTTVTVSGGIATFSNLSINKTGTGYTLWASSATLTGVISSPFNITPAKPDHLSFVQQPTSTTAGSTIRPAVTVQVLDAYNNLVATDQSDSITLAIGANPGGGTLRGTITVTVSGGVATFGNLSVNKTGSGYTLQASSNGLGTAASGPFTISPGKADHLVFLQQPASTTAGATITPAVTVEVLDANNNLVTTDNTDAVTLALANNPTGAALGGTTTVTASGGMARFSNLSVNQAGSGYTLWAGSASLGGATSAAFNVVAASTTTALESFENGLGLYNVVGGPYVNATAARSAAHDGSFGLDVYNSAGWLYRNDAAAQVHQGETLSAWVEFAYYANGRAYFGFGASATGTLSVVLAANTGQLLIQDNSGYGFTNLAAVPQYYQPNQWYRVEVVWGTGGSITAHLYGSNGTTLLNTVQATATAITAGGIAFRGIGFDKLFDTVTVTPNGSSQAAGLTGGTSQLLSGKSPAASPPSVAVVARLPVTSESVGMVFLLKPPGRRAPGAIDPLGLP